MTCLGLCDPLLKDTVPLGRAFFDYVDRQKIKCARCQPSWQLMPGFPMSAFGTGTEILGWRVDM